MFVTFQNLPDSSRLWIYQGNRPFNQEEESLITSLLQSFCEQWAAHGHSLKTSFKIEHHQFIILAADESYHLPSGCSIDSSVHIIKDIESKTRIGFFDRSLVAFWIDERVKLYPLSSLKDEFGKGTLTAETRTFDNLVATKLDWKNKWISPAKTTWLARYLPKTMVMP